MYLMRTECSPVAKWEIDSTGKCSGVVGFPFSWRNKCVVSWTPAAVLLDKMYAPRRIAVWNQKGEIRPMMFGRLHGKPMEQEKMPPEDCVVRRAERK